MISAAVRALLESLKHEPRQIAFAGTLPDRNELDNLLKASPAAYTAEKLRHQSNLIAMARRFARTWPPAPPGRVLIACEWREANARRDPDNIISGGRKLLLDALGPGRRRGDRGWQGAGLIHCDGRHCIAGFVDVIVSRPDIAGVAVIVAPVQLELPIGARETVVDLRGLS